MTAKINTALVAARTIEMGVSDEHFAAFTGISLPVMLAGADPDSLTLSAIGRVADLLALHPADLIDIDHPWYYQRPGGDYRIENVTADGSTVRILDLITQDGRSEDRNQEILRTLPYMRADGVGSPVIDSTGVRLVRDPRSAADPAALADIDQWMESHSILSAYEAIAALHLVRGHILKPARGHPMLTNRTTAQLLIGRRLAAAGDCTQARTNTLTPFWLDTSIEPHKDLLFALGLIAAPALEVSDPGIGTDDDNEASLKPGHDAASRLPAV